MFVMEITIKIDGGLYRCQMSTYKVTSDGQAR